MSYSEVHVGGSEIPMDSVAQKLIKHYMQPIEHFWEDQGITSIAVNRWDSIFIRKNGFWEKTDVRFPSESNLVNSIKTVINHLGQSIDELSSTIADGRFPDGSRVNAVLSPTAVRGSNMTIRLFPKVRYSLEQLMEKGVMNDEMLEFLKLSIDCEDNCLVSGATGSGKTTILNAMGNLIQPGVRLGVIEDTSELNIVHDNAIYLEAPKKSIKKDDKTQIITMESLLVNALREELAAVVVGEIRDPAAATALMLALNTGHTGVKSTLHANNDKAAMRRIINMLLSNDTRMPYESVRTEIFENFHLIVQTEHTPRHGKRIVHISEIVDDDVNRLYEWDYIKGEHRRVWTASKPPRLFSLTDKYGVDLPQVLKY